MNEIGSMINNFKIDSLHVIETSGGFAFAGKVPQDLRYVDPTEEQIKFARMGVPRFKSNAHLFPSLRFFATKQDAVEYATALG